MPYKQQQDALIVRMLSDDKLSSEQKELGLQLKEQGILGLLDDCVKFIQHFPLLKDDPYDCELYGETLANAMQVRSRMITKFKITRNICATRKAQFVLWLRFKSTTDVYLPRKTILDFCVKHQADLDLALEHLVQHTHLDTLYTTQRLRQKEMDIVQWIQDSEVLLQPHHLDADNLPTYQALDEAQEHSIRTMTLCGHAGCGKTLTVTELLRRLIGCLDQHPEVYTRTAIHAVAFMHKATQCLHHRLAGLNRVHVSTIHSFISQLKRQKNEDEDHDYDQEDGVVHKSVFLIIDEASMVELDLLGKLASVMLRNKVAYQLCFLGDPMQLPPVGRGEFFRALLHAEARPLGCHLTRCYRTQAHDLDDNYRRLRDGDMPQSSNNFRITVVRDNNEMRELMHNHVAQHSDAYKIICWQNKHIRQFNKEVQQQRLSLGRVGPLGFRGFCLHDHVIYCGEPGFGITNSCVGNVCDVTEESIHVRWQSGAIAEYNKKNVNNINLAYALTAHKAQGSEYDSVIVPCFDVHKMKVCLDRRWLYTAVTRGKLRVHLVVTPQVASFISAALKPLPITDIPFQELADVVQGHS